MENANNRIIENENTKIKNLQLLYECAKSEYLRECEREKIIENKAQIFIGILITFIALIIQTIPFESISNFLKLNNTCTLCLIVLMILVIIPVFYVMNNLVSIMNIKPHSRFAIEELKNEKLFGLNEEKMYYELINHYYEILDNEERLNEELAEKLKKTITDTVNIIVILVIIIIVLNIKFGGK